MVQRSQDGAGVFGVRRGIPLQWVPWFTVVSCVAAAMVFGCRQAPESTAHGATPPPASATQLPPPVASQPPQPRAAQPAGKLDVHVMNVGQGDAILIRCPEGTHEILIDSGETSRYPEAPARFKAALESRQARTNPIELVVATHPHSDHIGSMKWVVEEYAIGLYVDCGVPGESKLFRDLEAALAARTVRRKGAKDVNVEEADFCPLPDVKATILRPHAIVDVEDPNDMSVVVRVDYRGKSFLFAGDAEADEEQLLVTDPATKALLDCDFLKAGHHASETSSKTAFLAAVTPKVVAVSCGERDKGTNKRFKHPRALTLRNLLAQAESREGPALQVNAYESDELAWKKVNLNSAVYITAAQGDLVFESDGSSIHKRP